MTTHLINERGEIQFRVGDHVENSEARFFIGAINESQRLCSIDKTRPFELLNPDSKMQRCIKYGNYSASAETLAVIDTGKANP